jgi:hypothetical protein
MDPTLPSFFEFLSTRGNITSWWNLLHYLPAGGIAGLLTVLLLLSAWAALAVAVARRQKHHVLVSMLSAVAAAVVCWVGSYFGYLQVVRLMTKLPASPSPQDIADGGAIAAWWAYVPSVAALATIVAAVGAFAWLSRHPGAGLTSASPRT